MKQQNQEPWRLNIHADHSSFTWEFIRRHASIQFWQGAEMKFLFWFLLMNALGLPTASRIEEKLPKSGVADSVMILHIDRSITHSSPFFFNRIPDYSGHGVFYSVGSAKIRSIPTVELTAVYKDVFLVFGFITSDPSYTGLAFNRKTRGKNLHVEKPLASSSWSSLEDLGTSGFTLGQLGHTISHQIGVDKPLASFSSSSFGNIEPSGFALE